jgi:parallel beta-helix repeat protein
LYSSSPTLRWNNFHDNTNAGIYLISSSSPHLDSNYVRNNVYGVYCTTSSNPKFGNGSTHGLNDISGNSSYGVFCWNNSLPILGNNSPTDGGYNNLVNIATNAFNLYTLSSGTVYAINNWWGSTTNLRIAGPGGITFSPYLSSTAGDPKPPLSKSTNTFYASISCDIPFLDQLNKANEMIAENNLEQARKICLNLVTNYPDYSVSYNALNLIKDTYPASEINSSINTYTSLFNMKGKNNLYAMAGLILADIDKENKLNRIDDVINKYKKKSIVELALFDKFVFYYFEKQDRTNALAVSKELDEMFPLSQGAVEAHRILGDKEYYNIIPKQALQNTANQTPVEYALLGNYPNPFNPTTKINYSLPQDGEVLLKVFDTLGREVATLVNGFVNSGKHDVVWDGTNYASGIYFYSITFNGKTLNKKMLLMK